MRSRLSRMLSALPASFVQHLWAMLASLLLAGAVGALVMIASGVSPVRGYTVLFQGTLGDLYGMGTVLNKGAVLTLTGLAVAFPFLSGLFNIGAEGQLYFGAIGSVVAGIYLEGLPGPIHVPISLLAGFLAGAFWGAIPGWLKTRFGSNEVITSLMLSYVAVQFSGYLVTGPLKEPPGFLPQTAPVAPTALLPRIGSGFPAHAGTIVALLVTVGALWLIRKTTFGYEIRFAGANRRAARLLGIRVERTSVLVFALGGGLAGLAGAVELLGVQGRLLQGFSPGYGFDGIAVALVGSNHPIGVALAGLIFGGLRAGGGELQRLTGTPVALIFVIQGLLVIALAARTIFRRTPRSSLRSEERDEVVLDESAGQRSRP